MRDVLELYPRFSMAAAVAAGAMIALLGVTLMSADATTIPNPMQINGADNALPVVNSDCRADHWPYKPNCQMNGRQIRVIKF